MPEVPVVFTFEFVHYFMLFTWFYFYFTDFVLLILLKYSVSYLTALNDGRFKTTITITS